MVEVGEEKVRMEKALIKALITFNKTVFIFLKAWELWD